MAHYRIKLTGKMEPCDACLCAKARAKNTKKTTECVATTAREHLCLDTTRPFEPSLSSTRYDMKIVDQFSCKSWDVHMKTKDQLYEILHKYLDYLKGQGITVKYLWCDNAGEQGKKLAEFCKAHGIQVEYMAPNMPQQNGIIEQKIAMDHDCVYAMLLAAHLMKTAQNLLRAKVESTATKLSNLAWNQQVKGVPNDLFDGKLGQLHPGQLIEFGQVGYVTIQKQIKTKWEDKSMKCIMLGYADDHSGGTYRMYNPLTNHVQLTQDMH